MSTEEVVITSNVNILASLFLGGKIDCAAPKGDHPHWTPLSGTEVFITDMGRQAIKKKNRNYDSVSNQFKDGN